MQSIMGNVLNAHAQLKDTLCNIHELSKECLKFPARLIQGSYDLQSQTIKVRAVFDRRARSEKAICKNIATRKCGATRVGIAPVSTRPIFPLSKPPRDRV